MQALQRRASAVLAMAAVGVALLPSAAGATGAKRVEQGDGRITAGGAAITVPATFTCPAGYDAYISIQVVQAIGDAFAGGFDTLTKTCTGAAQKVKFYIQAVPAENTRPFRAGEASSRVILDAVDPAQLEPFPTEEFSEEAPTEDPLSILPPPPLAPADSTHARSDEPLPASGPATLHAEDRRTITLTAR